MTEGDYIEELLHKAEKYGFRNKLIEKVQLAYKIHTNSSRLDLYEHCFMMLENDFPLRNSKLQKD
jgi:hypothetical protein